MRLKVFRVEDYALIWTMYLLVFFPCATIIRALAETGHGTRAFHVLLPQVLLRLPKCFPPSAGDWWWTLDHAKMLSPKSWWMSGACTKLISPKTGDVQKPNIYFPKYCCDFCDFRVSENAVHAFSMYHELGSRGTVRQGS